MKDEKKTYWTMKNGEKIDVDLMTEKHLRNTLKMLINNSSVLKKGYNELDIFPSSNRWK